MTDRICHLSLHILLDLQQLLYRRMVGCYRQHLIIGVVLAQRMNFLQTVNIVPSAVTLDPAQIIAAQDTWMADCSSISGSGTTSSGPAEG